MAISSREERNYCSRELPFGIMLDRNSGNPIGILPAASTFYVHGLGNDIKVGWAVFIGDASGCSGWIIPLCYINFFQASFIWGSGKHIPITEC